MSRLLCRIFGHKWVNGIDIVFRVRIDECSRCKEMRGLMPPPAKRSKNLAKGTEL